MNTLKKVLALMLALVMVFSVASFADETKFDDAETVDARCLADVKLLAAVNILNGFKEGDKTLFKPNETITRGQAAKMIYVVYNGGTDDGAEVYKGMNTFTDTKGHWAEGYINACYTLDIVAGRGNGKFDPDAAVTGSELAKMLLTLGKYRSNVHGFTGADWAKNVNNFADLGGLTEGYKYQISLPAPRQWAAKMFVNALFNCFVAEYVGDNLVTGAYGSHFETYRTTIGEKYMELRSVLGYVSRTENLDISDLFDFFGDANAKINTDAVRYGSFSKGKVALPISISGNNREVIGTEFGSATLDQTFSNDMLGHEVRVVYAGDTLNSRTKLYGVFETGATVETETTMDNVTLNTRTQVLSFGDYKESITGDDCGDTFFNVHNSRVYVDGVLPVFDAEMRMGVYTDATEFGFELFGKNVTWPARFIDMDGNGIVDMLFVTDSYYAKVVRNNSARNLFTAQGAIDRVDRTDPNNLKALPMFVVGENRDYRSVEGDRYIAQYNATVYSRLVGADKVDEGDYVKLTSDVTSGERKINVERLEGTAATVGRKDYGVTARDFFNHVYEIGDKKFSFSYNYVNEANVAANNDIVYYTDGKYLVAADMQDKRRDDLTDKFAIVIETVDNAPGVDEYGRPAGTVNKVKFLNAAGKTVIAEYNPPARGNFVAFADVLVDGVYEYVEKADGTYYFLATPTATKNVWFGGVGMYPVISPTQATYGGMLVENDTYFFVREIVTRNGVATPRYSIKKLADFPQRDQSNDALKTVASYAYNIDKSSVRTAYFGTLLFDHEIKPIGGKTGWLLTTRDAWDRQVSGESHRLVEGIDETGARVVLDLGVYENGASFKKANADGSTFSASVTYYTEAGGNYTKVETPDSANFDTYYVAYNKYDWIKSGKLYAYDQDVDGISELFETPEGLHSESANGERRTFWTEASILAERGGIVQLKLDPKTARNLSLVVPYTLGTYDLHYDAKTVIVGVKTQGGEIVYVPDANEIARTAPYDLKTHNLDGTYTNTEQEYVNAYLLTDNNGYIIYIVIDGSYGGSVVGDLVEDHSTCGDDKSSVYAGNIYSNLSGGVQKVTDGWNRK